ncbi:hypothetical protein KGM_202384 [Danaus plexippus plexippus]|uniref:C2H2-type domain-containing protein n=1 Tax=Danaus plexippus plexippus TaxID=278856 RepID=A0A212EUC6_DANPL|nr:hypothetical protein KGM_202384 [Danaus plexippus plexippus]
MERRLYTNEALTCNVCDRSFSTRRALGDHQQKKRHFGLSLSVLYQVERLVVNACCPCQLQRVRQPVPVADGAGAPQGGVLPLERLVLLQLRLRAGRLPRGPPPAAIIPPHYCREQTTPLGHLRLGA